MTTAVPSRWFALVRTCIFATLFLGFFGFYLPYALGILDYGMYVGVREVGWIFLVGGLAIGLYSAFAFAWTGRGTPAPVDPPRYLVVSGMYRYVRNPMYFGMAIMLFGEWLLWGSNLRGALIYFGVFVAAATVFVKVHEEPSLRRKFGDDYLEYCRNVRRFLPRLHAWNPTKAKGATQG